MVTSNPAVSVSGSYFRTSKGQQTLGLKLEAINNAVFVINIKLIAELHISEIQTRFWGFCSDVD